MAQTILVTGGCGFIGSNFIHHILQKRPDWRIVNLDALTYAGNSSNMDGLDPLSRARYRFVQGKIQERDLISQLFREENFKGVINFAAESHVDRSIDTPMDFIDTNVVGTFHLIDTITKDHAQRLHAEDFKFIHVSTDEVFGSLALDGYFTEKTPYSPSSPYSASKAGSDHLVRAYFHTYGFPAIITNCSNNYGPFQFPEKLIPLIICNILEKRPLPVYGEGKNVRDWLYVLDHCDALLTVLEKGRIGESYNIGGGAERQNIEVVQLLCDLLDAKLGRTGEKASKHLIRFVTDRPGHDLRYAIDASKIKKELGWTPQYTFEKALEQTVDWYLDHMDWVRSIQSGAYRQRRGLNK
jgi:dTDP-glucose 4,6-dehydratase